MTDNSARRALVLVASDPTVDPRVEWMAEGLTAEFEVCELGVHSDLEPAPRYNRISDRRVRVTVGRHRHDWSAIPLVPQAAGSVVVQQMMAQFLLAEIPQEALARSIGAADAAEGDVARFRRYSRHFVNSSSALIQAARLIGNFQVIVAVDLDALPAALILAEEHDAVVVYDSHEFWPWSIPVFRRWEVEFWLSYERTLAPRADVRLAVSPQLASVMSQEYGCEFLPVPNCVSKMSAATVDVEAALRGLFEREELRFIFIGGFAPGRGLEHLISGWRHVDRRARLMLQGPDGEFKSSMIALARGYGLLDNGISFPEPVPANELIGAARQADVGIIPYAGNSINHRYCCPNKLSEYMAAGLPIVCNETEFVKSIVMGHGLGVCVDFSDSREFSRTIDQYVGAKDEIAGMSRRSHAFFKAEFNWERVSRDFYSRLKLIADNKPAPGRGGVAFDWVEEGREMRTPFQEMGQGASIFRDEELRRVTNEMRHFKELANQGFAERRVKQVRAMLDLWRFHLSSAAPPQLTVGQRLAWHIPPQFAARVPRFIKRAAKRMIGAAPRDAGGRAGLLP